MLLYVISILIEVGFSYFNVSSNIKGNQKTGRISGGPKEISALGQAPPKPICWLPHVQEGERKPPLSGG